MVAGRDSAWSSFGRIAAWTNTATVEADLAARSNAALKDTVLDKTRIAVAGRDVTFAADAFSEDGRRSAVAAVEAVPGVRLVNDETRLVPEAKPFVWSAERDVVRVTLAAVRRCRRARASCWRRPRDGLGGVEVVDQMTLARGAPPRFDSAALLLLDQIGKLKDGKITMSDTKVSLSGMARDLGGREAIAAALKNLPEGYSVAANDIKAPPYVFQAYKDPVAVTLTLTGYVPDNNVHAALVAAAGRKFFSEKVVDNLKASVGAPSGFADAVVPALGALSRLSTGTLVVSDREVKLSGDALYDAAADQIRAGLGKDFPQGWQFKAEFRSSRRRRRWMRPSASSCSRNCCRRRGSAFESGQGQHRPRIPPACSIAWSRPRCAVRTPRSRSPAIPTATVTKPPTRRCRKGARRRCSTIWSRPGLPPTASRRSAMARRSRSPATTPTKARRRTAASISW